MSQRSDARAPAVSLKPIWRARTREGIAVARAKGRLPGKQPKLSPKQEAHLVELYHGGEHTIGELEEPFPVTRSTIYRAVARADAHTSKGTPKQTRSGPCVFVTTLNTFSSAEGAVLNRNRRTVALRNPLQESS